MVVYKSIFTRPVGTILAHFLNPIPSHPIPSHPSWGRAEPLWTSSLHLTQQQWSSQPFQLSVFSLILLKIPSEIEIALRYPLLPLFTGLSCYTVQAALHCLKSRMFVQLMTSCFSCYHVLMFWCLFISCSSVHVNMFWCADVCLSHDLMFMLSWDLMFLYSHVLIKMLNEWTRWYPLSYYVYVSTCGAKMVYEKGRFPDAGPAHFLLWD